MYREKSEAPLSELSSHHSSFVKSFAFALKQFRLYSSKHPITQESLKTLSSEIQKFFSGREKITLGTMQHRLIVDGQTANEKDASSQDLAKEFERLGIEGLNLLKGLSLPEVTVFMDLMAARSKALEGKGGFKKAFEMAQFQHIRLSTGKFALIEDGHAVVKGESAPKDDVTEETKETTGQQPSKSGEGTGAGSEGPGGGGGGGTGFNTAPLTSIAQIIHRIREEKGQPSTEMLPPIRLDSEKIIGQLEKNPEEMAKLTLENVTDATQLEQVVRKIIRFMIEGLIKFLIEQGKDITKALERFAKELEKSLKRLGEGEQFKNLRKKIPQIFEEGTDELRVQMVVGTYKENPEDSKKLKKMVEKLLKDPQVRGRLAPDIKDQLASAGMPAGDTQTLFTQLEEKIEKKSRRVSVDSEELEELREKAAKFDHELEKRIKDKVNQFEKEKKKILDEKERVDSVIRNLAEGLLVVDKQGKVIMMNPAAERLLGIKQSEKMGKPVTEGLSPQHVVSMTNGNLQDTEQVAKHVEVVSLNDDTQRVLQASTGVIENEDGQTVGMVSVLTDVTREKELSELKSKFVANVSHELRTPLVAIQKSLSLILAKDVGEVNPEQEKFLTIATRNIDRLSRLINELLDISKLEAGKANLRPKEIPVRELVMHVISTVEPWGRDKEIIIETSFSNDQAEIEADPDRITQVLTNLVGNAIKFTPNKGKIKVEVKSDIDDLSLSDQKCIEIAVIDSGIGIAPEDQKKIFDKFVQVSLVQPTGISGTGLGLPIAREIVELHSGKIWVESEPNKGSRFAFRIPMVFKLHEPPLPKFA